MGSRNLQHSPLRWWGFLTLYDDLVNLMQKITNKKPQTNLCSKYTEKNKQTTKRKLDRQTDRQID